MSHIYQTRLLCLTEHTKFGILYSFSLSIKIAWHLWPMELLLLLILHRISGRLWCVRYCVCYCFPFRKLISLLSSHWWVSNDHSSSYQNTLILQYDKRQTETENPIKEKLKYFLSKSKIEIELLKRKNMPFTLRTRFRATIEMLNPNKFVCCCYWIQVNLIRALHFQS